MGPYLGDYVEDAIVVFGWDTNDKEGASVTRATDGTIKVYKDDGTTESTAGIIDTEDFDGITGVHNCKIDLSADAFYAIGHDYSVVLVGAVIDGETVNAVLATFSIENRFAAELNNVSADEVADAVCDELLASHTTAGTLGKKISDIPTGLGAVAVDHNYGGTDALRYVDGAGSGIDNADIWIYLKSDYDAGRVSSNYVKAKTNTDVNGRWANPVNLDPATYTIHVYKQGEYGPDTQEITVE